MADACQFEPATAYDVVMAAYLLNYARNQHELQSMANGIARCLKSGGRFVTVNRNSALKFFQGPLVSQIRIRDGRDRRVG